MLHCTFIACLVYDWFKLKFVHCKNANYRRLLIHNTRPNSEPLIMTQLVRNVLGFIRCVTRKEECCIWRNVMTSDPCRGRVLHMSNMNSLPNLWKPRKEVRGQILVPVPWQTHHPRPGTDIIVVITVQSWVDPRVDLVKRKMLSLHGSRTATLQTPLN